VLEISPIEALISSLAIETTCTLSDTCRALSATSSACALVCSAVAAIWEAVAERSVEASETLAAWPDRLR
jgi:hypothetical protein